MKPFYPFTFSCFLAASATASAQLIPPSPALGDDHVHLENMVVTATPLPRNQAELVSATTVLTGRALQMKRQPTLGDTLSEEVGMSATSFGPGASRPVIRGLGGDRIRILENGLDTFDASVTSPDHAVSVEPFLVKRIEVVRGPASLLYGSSAVGGVVNVITHRIETEIPERRIAGSIETGYGTATNQRNYGGVAHVALLQREESALVLHVDGFRRTSGNVEIPGFAESARLRAEGHAEHDHEHDHEDDHDHAHEEAVKGVVPNSQVRSDGGAAGVSWVSHHASLGVAYSGFNTRYGVPGHSHAHSDEDGHPEEGEDHEEDSHEEAPVKIDLRQRRVDMQGELRRDDGLVSALRFKVGHADYRHQELEGDEIGTVFTHRGYNLRAETLHRAFAGFEGAVGLEVSRGKFAALGEEAFLEPSETKTRALFLAEEAKTGSLRWQWGARYEHQEIELKDRPVNRSEDTLSASAGLVWTMAEPYVLALSVSHTERGPNAQELYADGPHVGTRSYERGDDGLRSEKSLGMEISLRRTAGRVTGSASVYANQFQGYIYADPTDETEDGLPVYAYTQTDADFWGAELEAIFHLHSGARHQFDVRVMGDFTRAEDGSGRPLPRIPALRGGVGMDWFSGNFSIGTSVQRVARQSRVAANESTTDGYTLVSAYLNYRATVGAVTLDWFLRGTNLADEEIRPHTSYLKEMVPLAGRGLTAGVQLAF